MIKIEVAWDKGGFKNFIRYIENNLVYGEAQEAMVEIADDAVKNMKETIQSSKKRPGGQNNLENAIESEILNSTGGIDIGIGNITKLKSDAPYYEVLDVGGYIPYSTAKGAPLGTFFGDRPVAGGSGQNWERSGNKGFFMRPAKPMEGIDYVGKMLILVEKELNAKVKEMGEKLLEGMRK